MDFFTTHPQTILWLLLFTTLPVHIATQTIIRVNYGYFPEARPFHAACARGWFDLYTTRVQYRVTCFPQTSGNFASSRLDNEQLDIALLGSTPMAQALARGIDLQVFYITQYQGDSQGIYVRPSDPENNYVAISNPFELAGRKVGVPFGSTMHYQLLFLIDLIGLQGDVDIIDLSPAEIIQAWDRKAIDAAACWGVAREHVLQENSPENSQQEPGNVLVTAQVLANWGRPTFVNAAVRRSFAEEHPDFMNHFVGVMSRLNDAFVDRLGETDTQNRLRWDAQREAPTSLVPSMADALMKAGETAQNPSQAFINQQRRVLDLFIQQSVEEQLSCDFLKKNCRFPTGQHIDIQRTAEFLLEQKLIPQLGPLETLGDDTNCQDSKTLCGGDLFSDEWLEASTRDCGLCYPVGRYTGERASSSTLISSFESLDATSGRTPYPLNEIGRAGRGEISKGDSTCKETSLISARVPGTFTDGAAGADGKGYSGKPNNALMCF